METDRKPGEESRTSEGSGDAVSRSAPIEASKTTQAPTVQADPTQQLMEVVLGKQNLIAALERVEANKGSAGIDGMTTEELRSFLKGSWEQLRGQLLTGEYRPQPVRRVVIPKPGGGERNLGIPTVLDRFIQQALLQVMAPLFDPHFSKSSHGFREGRSAHEAVRAARGYVAEGMEWVVDLDIEKFFDHVNHDILMRLISERVKDKRVLKLIGRYLRAGVMTHGVVIATGEGTPQGGPLSPLLSNIMLDVFDKELERRGLRFSRYADDCNIYVRSERAAQRVMASVTKFLGQKLKLRVNPRKSAVARPQQRRFLGFTIRKALIRVAPESRERLHQKVVELTGRSCGRSIEQVIERLNKYLLGWSGYYALGEHARWLTEMDGWIRRRLRQLWWVQRKTPRKRWEGLAELGTKRLLASTLTSSQRGPWRLSKTEALHAALNQKYFDKLGLVSLAAVWEQTRKKWQLAAVAS